MSNELPQGWATAPLREIAEARMGETILAKQLTPIGVPVYSAGQANEPWGFLDQPKRLFSKGTVVVSARGSIGFPKIPKAESFTSTQTTIVLRFPDGQLSEFVCHWLKTVDWKALTKGGAIPMLTVSDINELVAPLAPLSEQRRIVAKLKKLLSKVDVCQKRLAKFPVLLKRFRQSVLAAACSGRLTADWREENASGPWDEKTIGEIELFVGSGITPKGGKAVYVTAGVPFIRSQNVYPTGLRLDDIAYIRPELHKQMSRTHVQPLDVLLNITGASIGRSTVVPEKFGEANVNQHVCIIRPKPEMIPRFLSMFLNSPSGQDLIFETQVGVTREGLNYGQLRDFRVPVPPVPEQQQIVRRVESLFALADQIEARFQKAQAQVEKLTPSILAKAFRGSLVPQDPSDEPASILLGRIKDRELPKGKGKSKRN